MIVLNQALTKNLSVLRPIYEQHVQRALQDQQVLRL